MSRVRVNKVAVENGRSFPSARPGAQTPPAPAAFHVMLKPRGAICNLDCTYCYYLAKEMLYPGSRFTMARELLENYTRQYIQAQPGPEVTFTWQGGEPTLLGLAFFEQAVQLQQQYARPGLTIHNAIQTNGVLLDDEWCRFFQAHNFLVGLSLDGPRELHDTYRVDKGGRPTFERVMGAVSRLQQHQVEYNILATVHAANAPYPLEVYRFLRDEVGARFLQFIPIVERSGDGNYDGVRPYSVSGRAYGDFLIAIFNEWVRRDVGRVFVQIFDVALAAWAGLPPGLCIFAESCGTALALEHNGDLYSCDHFVEPAYHLGNIEQDLLLDMVTSERQQAFGRAKRDSLPQYCRACEVRFVCNGGCPKDRFLTTPQGEPGLNYLCAGYRAFFNHIDRPMRVMATELKAGRPPANIMTYLARATQQVAEHR
jgi:uncharacterized protein